MKHSKSGIMLMEIIICIFFFALTATVCSQIFAKSHILSEDTIRKNHAVIEVENVAECYYVTFGDIDALKNTFYPDCSEINDSSLFIYYDEDFNLIKSDSVNFDNINFEYVLILEINQVTNDGMINSTITFNQPKNVKDNSLTFDSIYSLNVNVNKPNTLADSL